MPDNVARRDTVNQYYARKTMTDCRLHASSLQFTNWRPQEIGDITQVLDPGVDEIDKCYVVYPAGELPGVDLPVGDVNEDSFIK